MSYYSIIQYIGDGSTQTFSVPFQYLAQSDVSCTVNGVTVAVTWTTSATVQLTAAPAAGTQVMIRRTTSITNPSVVFNDGSTLSAADLNSAILQDLYASQEAIDTYGLIGAGGGTGGSTTRFFSEQLTVTSTNVLTTLSFVPDGKFIVLAINEGAFLQSSGAFTVVGQTVTWNPVGNFPLPPGANVSISYTY